MRKLLELSKRMEIRLARDVKDRLSVDKNLSIDKVKSLVNDAAAESPGSVKRRQKRSFKEAFGEERSPCNESESKLGSSKRILMERDELKDCKIVIDTYRSGIDQVIAQKHDSVP